METLCLAMIRAHWTLLDGLRSILACTCRRFPGYGSSISAWRLSIPTRPHHAVTEAGSFITNFSTGTCTPTRTTSSEIGLGVKDNRGLIAGVVETASADPLAENFCGISAFYSIPATGLICRGFLWRDGLMTGLPTLGGANSLANSANNRGETVGAAENSVHDSSCMAPQQLDYEAVVWGPGMGEIQTLPPLPGDKV